MEKAENILSKYKNAIHKKIHTTSEMSWLIYTLKSIISTADKMMKPHNYKFENNQDAAKYNTKLLKRSKYNLTLELCREKGAMMDPGSESISESKLEPLFKDHKYWQKMSEIVSKVISYPLEEISNK